MVAKKYIHTRIHIKTQTYSKKLIQTHTTSKKTTVKYFHALKHILTQTHKNTHIVAHARTLKIHAHAYLHIYKQTNNTKI